LVVDPVLSYSTYIGGSGSFGTTLKADSAGNMYYARVDVPGSFSTMISRLDPSTNTVVYETSLGSARVNTLQLGGPGGNMAHVAGSGLAGSDAFIAIYNPNGTLARNLSFGGSSFSEDVTSMALDAAGNIYVGGYTQSVDFPVTAGQPL